MDRHQRSDRFRWSSYWLQAIFCLSLAGFAYADPPATAQPAQDVQPLAGEVEARIQEWDCGFEQPRVRDSPTCVLGVVEARPCGPARREACADDIRPTND